MKFIIYLIGTISLIFVSIHLWKKSEGLKQNDKNNKSLSIFIQRIAFVIYGVVFITIINAIWVIPIILFIKWLKNNS